MSCPWLVFFDDGLHHALHLFNSKCLKSNYDNAVSYYRNYMNQFDWYDNDTRAEIEASAYHKQAIADYEALIRQLSCNAFVK